jgi:hypothetical protein
MLAAPCNLSLTPRTPGHSFSCRSEALTKAFLLTPRDTDVPGAREIPKQVVWPTILLAVASNPTDLDEK